MVIQGKMILQVQVKDGSEMQRDGFEYCVKETMQKDGFHCCSKLKAKEDGLKCCWKKNYGVMHIRKDCEGKRNEREEDAVGCDVEQRSLAVDHSDRDIRW